MCVGADGRKLHWSSIFRRCKRLQETDAWLNTLFELAPLLDKEVLKSEVLSLALSKGDVEGSVSSRIICARILGALAPRLVCDKLHACTHMALPCPSACMHPPLCMISLDERGQQRPDGHAAQEEHRLHLHMRLT